SRLGVISPPAKAITYSFTEILKSKLSNCRGEKSPPFEGGEAALASAIARSRRRRGGFFNHPACSQRLAGTPPSKGGDFRFFQFVHSFMNRPYNFSFRIQFQAIHISPHFGVRHAIQYLLDSRVCALPEFFRGGYCHDVTAVEYDNAVCNQECARQF